MIRLSSSSSFSYVIDANAGVALARMHGTITGGDMHRIAEIVHDDPEWKRSFDAIWDCTRVTSHVVAPGEVSPIIDEVTDGQTGTDVLVENAGLAESLLSMLLTLRARVTGSEAHVCETVAEALHVLGHNAMPPGLDLEDADSAESVG